ncbi:hypothetical protein [Delftia sp. PS-11]|uniref:hypothetical protein n=1 Tax=Delftia sp. PS-11 TaxID=2767222 RepID=UPI00245759D2|nr:hypothetical protein [Delftia sp. PS-11]KAJ8746348.1 hypothetical protein H9T68_01720 [Delftia sp. PS-11]
MTQLPPASRPDVPTSVHVLLSRPAQWRAGSGDSRHSRFWRQELLESDLRPMQQQLVLLSAALEEAVRVRCAGRSRPVVEEAVQQLGLAALEHQYFLTTLASGWRLLYEFPAYQRLLRSFCKAVRAWQQSVLLGDAREAEHFRQCERLGWRLLGDASLLIDMFAESVRGGCPAMHPLPVKTSAGPHGMAGLLRRLAHWLRLVAQRRR